MKIRQKRSRAVRSALCPFMQAEKDRSGRRKEMRTGGKKRSETFYFVDKPKKRLYNNYGGIAGDHDCSDGKFYPNQQRRRVCRKVSEI